MYRKCVTLSCACSSRENVESYTIEHDLICGYFICKLHYTQLTIIYVKSFNCGIVLNFKINVLSVLIKVTIPLFIM